MSTIDWGASAKLSSARGTDEFVVREYYADEAPRAILVCDHRASMAHFESPLPWLSKREAMDVAVRLVALSVMDMRGFLGYLDYADGGEFWEPPRSRTDLVRFHDPRPFQAPVDSLTTALWRLVDHRRALPPGSFVFVLSDFLEPPDDDAWARVLRHRWDVVPVVIQDPVWEQSFPDVAGVVLRLADPNTGRTTLVRLSRRDVEDRRAANERRLAELLRGFQMLDLDPVVLSSSQSEDVLECFVGWSDQRLFQRGHLR